MTTSEQVVLIGLDGLGRSAIDEWIDDGTLSTLASIRDQGCMADLESTIPPWTPCAWPSLLSGRNPGEHGVFDFYTNDGYEKSIVDRQDVRAPYIWEVADELGFSSVAINFPVTHPVSELEHGAIIPGYLASENTTFHPPEIRDAFEERFGEYRIYPEYNASSGVIEKYVDVARCRRDMAQLLTDRFDWDLLAVQFQVTDSIFHDLENSTKIREVLQSVDSYVSDIVDLADQDPTVIIASDHGMGEYRWTFYINSWLADHGYCQTTAGNPEYFSSAKNDLRSNQEETRSSPINRLAGGATNALSRIGLTPRAAHRALAAVGLAGHAERLLPEETQVALQNRTIDWEQSKAFQLLFNSLGVHINARSSWPSGRVPEEQYENVRANLMADLRSITDPEGRAVFEAVHPREEVYHGSNVDRAPDIVFVPREYQYDVSGSVVDTFRRHTHMNHKPDGIFLSNRPTMTEESINRLSIFDVAPTVAVSLGIPADTDADGEAVPIVETTQNPQPWQAIAESHLSRSIGNGKRSDTDAIERRLSDLGYLE
ncbi:alkaline phosphatase family protein [Haloarcula sp. 1CSR25-25]|uniref:alkaline phosphatase family protein n=1 Tax=Haloarcula sp. 1CSR25-25 TaxID=2862545 RepID=UPI0028949164|nr:alkaline phosphatase family protein [Haloarcula sp. 1CSR25-25]MDT3435469.1 alkaline phosphatase family protein [Haloarcula sp. 1CSR25-25]